MPFICEWCGADFKNLRNHQRTNKECGGKYRHFVLTRHHLGVEPYRSQTMDNDTFAHRRREIPKYPRTLYWPTSPGASGDSRYIRTPERFVDVPVVVTEKIDGSCTLLHQGLVYGGRSTSEPTRMPWHGMVKKHHAWKFHESGALVYGEDIFGVHSIVYDPVYPAHTFFVFAVRWGDVFAAFEDVEEFALSHDIATVPVLYRGVFGSIAEIDEFFAAEHDKPSMIGGEREGVVMRLADEFDISVFSSSVCKSVRKDHVQTDEHWRLHWEPCKLR